MKKLLIVALMFCLLPAMAVELGGKVDVDYMMNSLNDSALEAESYFGMVSSKITLKWNSDAVPGEEGEAAASGLPEGMEAFIKLALNEPKSEGIDSKISLTAAIVGLEEFWVSKKGAFKQEALGFKFGKMEVPFNLDVDNGITHSMTNRSGSAYTTGGATGEIDYTWGINANYDLGEGKGVINLTVFEGGGGLNAALEDADSGLFESLALNWDTGKGVDAFGVAGLRIVVGYAMLANASDDTGTEITVGATYTLKDLGLTFGLEGTASSSHIAGNDVISVDVDYVQAMYEVGLTYEMSTYRGPETTDTRIAIRANYVLDPKNKIRFEYAMTANADDSDLGGSTISLGYLTSF